MSVSPRFSPETPRLVEILAFPAVQLLDIAGPMQVFATANDLTVQAGGRAPYAPRVVAPGGSGVKAGRGAGKLLVGRKLSRGTYRLTVTATDAAGNRTKARVVTLVVR